MGSLLLPGQMKWKNSGGWPDEADGGMESEGGCCDGGDDGMEEMEPTEGMEQWVATVVEEPKLWREWNRLL